MGRCGACRKDFNASLALDESASRVLAETAAATMRASAGCSVVLYTVTFGGYDSFATF
jgi:hypothetical protein